MKPELIETMHANPHGKIDLWDQHMARLRHSASLLGYAIPSTSELATRVAQQIAQTRQAHAPAPDAWRVRLLLSEQGTVSVTAVPLTPLQGPQKVALSSTPINSQEFWLQHKSTYRPWYEQANTWLMAHPDYFDVLFVNERGEICEGSRSNVYLQQQGQWLTPSSEAGLLPGVWRTLLLQQTKVQETTLHSSLLKDGMILRLSNGLRGWFDVQLDTQIRTF